MAAKDELGRRGETLAAEHLAALGYRLIERNWRCPQGEVDLILEDGDVLVFAEVKTRSSLTFGHPLTAITTLKLARLRRLAAAWCDEHAGRHDRVRIDAVAVLAPMSGPAQIDHLRGVF